MHTDWTLDDDDALAAIAVIKAELLKRGKPGVIAIVDNHGETIAVLRQKGAAYSGVQIACNKAFTAVRLRRPSGELGRTVRHPEFGYDIAYFSDARYVGFGGGMPVMKDGAFVGAVGVSGLTQAEDDELAQMGVAAILAR